VAAPQGPVLASIGEIRKEGLLRETFALSTPQRVQIHAEGLADPRGTVFLAQGWVLDLETRQPVWTMKEAGGKHSSRTDNWTSESEVTLRPGAYAVYFAALGGVYPLNQDIKLFGVPVGRIEGDWGRQLAWDERGKPERWGIEVRAVDPSAEARKPAELPQPYGDADVRLLGLANGEVRRVRLDVSRPARCLVRFTGEYSRSAKGFADAAWMSRLADWSTVWEPDYETTSLAGGAEKNRRFEGEVLLQPGAYLVTAAADASHAADAWNTIPPWDPESWGLALWVPDDAKGSVQVSSEEALPRPVVHIDRVGDDDLQRKVFVVTRRAPVLVRAYGEMSGRRQFADFAWIERTSDLETVWTMREAESRYCGGASKNRMVEVMVELDPGSYALCYVTDDSHSYGSWNAEPPWEPQAWGASLAEISLDPGRPGGAVRPGGADDSPVLISLAPMRSDQKKVRRFEIIEAGRVEVIAIGEGEDGDMYDFGWLENEDNGQTVWTMTWRNSEPAGGARKNRKVRTTLDLPKGSYALHFVTDGSHAFGDWNALPPDQPGLWGVTLLDRE